jgi:CBS domain-containing protein
MRISDILRSKGSFVATVPPDVTVAEVVAELARLKVGALVVSSDGQRITGIVSERDVARHLHLRGGSVMEHGVTSIMTSEVHTCRPDDDVESLMVTMTDRRIRHVPVVQDDVLAGIVSIGDVVKSRIAELEQERQTLVDYITTGR